MMLPLVCLFGICHTPEWKIWILFLVFFLRIVTMDDCCYLQMHLCIPIEMSASSLAQSCPTLCNSMDCSTPGLHVHHHLPEFTQTHVHRVVDTIQPSHALSTPSPPALNLSQHQGPFKWVSSSHQVTKILEFQLQHQSFQWTPRTDLL